VREACAFFNDDSPSSKIWASFEVEPLDSNYKQCRVRIDRFYMSSWLGWVRVPISLLPDSQLTKTLDCAIGDWRPICPGNNPFIRPVYRLEGEMGTEEKALFVIDSTLTAICYGHHRWARPGCTREPAAARH